MTRVSLVSTYHAEKGLVTVDALVAILEGLSPKVILLEIPPAAFEDYERGIRANLESSAARKHRESHDVVLVPVDLPTPDASFFRYDEYLHRRVEQTSPEYCHLVDLNSLAISRYGFSYLNSDDCSEAWSAINRTIQVAIDRLPDRTSLLEHLRLSTDICESRDRGMLRNIEEYHRLRPFSTGALLVGAAHRRSLITKSRGRPADAPPIEWAPLDGLA
jgi:hypothetical protein